MDYGRVIARALSVTPPTAAASFIASATTTAATVQLSTIGASPQNIANATTREGGPFDSMLEVQNDGAANTLYVIFAGTSVAAAALLAATTGTNAAAAAYAIPPNTSKRFRIRPGVDLFMGYLSGATTTTLRAFVTSDQG